MSEHFKESLRTSLTSGILILKLVVPFFILADILLYFDLLAPLSTFFSPITTILQLPTEAAMALCAGMFLNLYAAVAFAAPLNLSPYQWTILGIFLGVCHSLPVESVIMKKLGISFLYSVTLRLSMAFLTTLPIIFLPRTLFSTISGSSKSVQLASYSSAVDMLTHSLLGAAVLSMKIILLISIIIFIMDAVKRSRFVQRYSERVSTSFSLLAGLLLGITYGAGILFKEADSGNLKREDLLFIGTFLMICHSILEDSLLFVLFGANYWVITLSRLLMAILVSSLISRWFSYKPA